MEGTRSLRMARSVNGLDREQDPEDVYYTPGFMCDFVAQEIASRGHPTAELNYGRDRDMFTDVKRVNNVGLARSGASGTVITDLPARYPVLIHAPLRRNRSI